MEVKKFFSLSLNSIDEANKFVRDLLIKNNCTKLDNVRAQLFVEETIVFWEKEAQENQTFEISIRRRFKTITLSLNYWGNQSNPLTLPEDPEDPEFSLIGQNILIGLSSVTYAYENGCNNVSYTLKAKSANPAMTTGIALGAGILCGLIVQYFSPATGLVLANTILTPLSQTFFGFLNAIVIPVLFFSAIGSIFNMDNMAQMKRIFRILLSWSLGIILLASTVSLLAAQFTLLSQDSATTGGATGDLWNQIGEMIFGIIPTNVLQPFLDGNTLQIMFLAIVGGIVMLTLKGRFPFITKVITEGNLIFSTILDAICTLMPWVVFISILNMMVSGNGGALLGAIGLIALILLAFVAINLFLLLSVLLIEKINPMTYLKTIFPFLIIAFSTASSSATLASHNATAVFKQGIRDYVVNFSIPVGVLFNKQFAIPILLLTSLFIGRFYQITFTLGEIIPVVILCMILSVAVPPSPGMGPFLFTIVFNLLGIPLEGLALAVTIDIFMDYPATAGHVMITNIGMLHTEHLLRMKENKRINKVSTP
ncbi:MAG: dicarboxylate/amino acid:cation symporter [Acetobacterium sp.]